MFTFTKTFPPGLPKLGALIRCSQNRYTAVQTDLKYPLLFPAVKRFHFLHNFFDQLVCCCHYGNFLAFFSDCIDIAQIWLSLIIRTRAAKVKVKSRCIVIDSCQ